MSLQPYDPPARQQLALMNPVTDSWTAVLGDVVSLAENIATTEFVPLGLRGSTAKTTAAILHGRELGLPPMTALAHTSVINGRPGTSAEVMRALILQAGHDLDIQTSTSERCTIAGRRSTWAEDRWTTVTWTIQDAAKAGLLEDKRNREGKVTPSMYKKWPAAMLLARSTTTLARMIFSDVIHGMRSVEELQEMEAIDSTGYEPAPQTTTAVSRRPSLGAPAAVESEATATPGGAAGASAEGVGATSEQQPAAPAPARKRPPLRPKGRATTPAPEVEREVRQYTAGSAVGTGLPSEPDADGVVDAEVVEPAHSASEWRQKTTTQVVMQWQRILGQPVERDERIFWTGVIAGRPVDSTNDLADEELATLLNELGKLRGRDELEALNRKAGDRDE